MQPYHRDPEDYWRWTLDGLRLFAKKHGFEEIRRVLTSDRNLR